MLEPLTAHVTWIVLLAHSWSLHGLNKIVNRFLGAGDARATSVCRKTLLVPALSDVSNRADPKIG
ncbi:hypothetical protein BRO06_10955 [Xanthomonas oryzae pv. oryzae]|nr:hypothetical protein BRO06_10955 [Xanthomonas oryzae pv. oryzae]